MQYKATFCLRAWTLRSAQEKSMWIWTFADCIWTKKATMVYNLLGYFLPTVWHLPHIFPKIISKIAKDKDVGTNQFLFWESSRIRLHFKNPETMNAYVPFTVVRWGHPMYQAKASSTYTSLAPIYRPRRDCSPGWVGRRCTIDRPHFSARTRMVVCPFNKIYSIALPWEAKYIRKVWWLVILK